MQDQQQTRKRQFGILAAVSTAVVAAAGASTAWWAWNSLNPNSETTQTPTTSQLNQSPETVKPAQEANEQGMEIYWLKTEGNKILVTSSSINVEATEQPDVMLAGAFERLLVGPKEPEYATTIPKGTKLLDIATKTDGVHVNLSEEFTSGGGSTSMTGRLAQVLYTATSLNPSAPVWISVEGEPLEVLGGEGVLVDQPMTRQDFNENFEL